MAESPLMLPGSRKDRGGGYLNNNNNNNNSSDCCCCKPDPCDSSSQGTNDDRFDRDLAGLFEDRFRVDRRKLEQMLQGQGETFEPAEDFFQRIMDETNTQITWPSKLKIGAKSKKDPHIKVIGVPIDVKMAKDKIMSILDTKSNRVTLKMDVSHTDHSHVIGKGGNNIKKVMQATGCHIHFPDSNRGNNVQEKSNQVSIAGQPSGVENARTQIRELLPLVFIFELSLLQPYPDPSSSTIQQLQQMYNVTITFKQRPRTYVTTITVRGSVYNAKAVKEATMRLMEHLISNIAVSLPVSMQLEIAPQHHLFMIGRGGMNVKQIMQRTGASVHFPDPNTVSPQRKGTVYITGGIESVYQARQQLIGCLPLVLMFDIKEDIEIDQAQITQLMEQLDVFISVKPKPKQPSKSVIVKSVERNAANMYAARLRILGLDKDERTIMSPGSTTSSNGTSGSNDGLGLSSLAISILHTMQAQHLNHTHSGKDLNSVMSPSMLTVNTSNTLLMVNGQHNPPLVSPASSPSPTCPGQWLPPPPGVYGPMMVVNSTSTASLQCALDVFSQCNGLQKGLPHSCAFSQCEQDSSCSNSKTSSPNHLHNDIPGSFSSDCNTTGSIQSHHNIPVDLKGINCSDTFEKIVNRQISPTSGRLSLGLLDLGKPPLTSLPKTQSMVLDAVSLASSDRSSESGNDSEGSDKRAPGSERKKSAANLFPSPSPFAVDYEQKKLLATKAMQKKPVGESRIPTDIWSGMGFSKSMPESAIRDRFGQSANCNRMCGMLMAYQNSAELPGDMDQDPWKDSKPLNAPMNPAPGEFPSPRKRYEFGLSNSNHVDSTTLPTKTLWSPKIDLAELFSELGLGKYTDLFQQQEIDLATFMTMNDDDLRLLGISTFGARRKMLLAIADLHNQRSQLSTVLSSNNPFQENGALWLNNRRPDIGSLSGRW